MGTISVNSVSKSFYADFRSMMTGGLKDILSLYAGKPPKEAAIDKNVIVFNNFSMSVSDGEIICIKGSNGKGKTTLLKMICGIIQPDAGTISIKGRCFPLFYRGGGFRLLLSGRENIYFTGNLLSIPKKQIDVIVERIIDFSGLKNDIDRPLRTYSDGMYSRLLISFAICSGFEIILVDELLSACDENFRKKALSEFKDLSLNGISFLIVSHNETEDLNIFSRIIRI